MNLAPTSYAHFIDDFSRFAWIYLLRQKLVDVCNNLEAFIQFKILVKISSMQKLKQSSVVVDKNNIKTDTKIKSIISLQARIALLLSYDLSSPVTKHSSDKTFVGLELRCTLSNALQKKHLGRFLLFLPSLIILEDHLFFCFKAILVDKRRRYMLIRIVPYSFKCC